EVTDSTPGTEFPQLLEAVTLTLPPLLVHSTRMSSALPVVMMLPPVADQLYPVAPGDAAEYSNTSSTQALEVNTVNTGCGGAPDTASEPLAIPQLLADTTVTLPPA